MERIMKRFSRYSNNCIAPAGGTNTADKALRTRFKRYWLAEYLASAIRTDVVNVAYTSEYRLVGMVIVYCVVVFE
jgi:hypothetical protein